MQISLAGLFKTFENKLNSFLQNCEHQTPGQQAFVQANQQTSVLYFRLSDFYSQSIKIMIGPSDGGTIVPSTHRPIILY